jgi:hypothetical protein
VRLIYLSSRKGILVARLDAVVIELRVSKGPVGTTRVSSARVDRVCGCATCDAAHGRSRAARLG